MTTEHRKSQSGHAQEIVREMMRRDRKTVSAGVRAFAHRVGLVE